MVADLAAYARANANPFLQVPYMRRYVTYLSHLYLYILFAATFPLLFTGNFEATHHQSSRIAGPGCHGLSEI